MADHYTAVSQAEISALKEALCAQQKLLQKLYNELEAEREASATAASEALSVILRLQGEKAAVKMEAEHYKRLAEEKMCHQEESFAMIEDIIHQKEMEMADLDYQVQTYKYQLISMGLVDPGDDDVKIPKHLLHRNECFVGDSTGLHRLGRRNSAPLLEKYKKAMFDIANSAGPEMDLASKNVEEQTGQEVDDVALDSERKVDSSVHVGIDSYAEQIRELELRVKEIAGAGYKSPSLSSWPSAGNLSSLSNSVILTHTTRPLSPQPSLVNPNGPSKVSIMNEISSQTKHSPVDYPCSSSIHDVFEVPQADRDCESSSKCKKVASSAESKGCSHSEVVKKPFAKDEPDWLKKLLQSTHNEKNLCKPSDIAAIDRGAIQPAPSVSKCEPSSSNIDRSSEIAEVERLEETIIKREEELKLLKEIKEKLNILQDEIRCQKMKESSMAEEPSLSPVSEAMLCFWI